MEALQHWAFRWNPEVLTIRKVPPEGVLWVAPLVYLGIFLLVAVVCWVVSPLIRRWPAHLLLLYACVFLAAYGQLTLTGKVHRVGALVFSVGAAVAVGRAMKNRPGAWTVLARAAPFLCAIITLPWGGATLTAIARERSTLAALPPARAGAPSVLLIVLDTVRADHLSLHGYPRATTPKLDQWARRGAVLDNAWSVTSWTLPSHASMLTGLPTHVHGAGTNKGRGLGPDHPMLSEFLRDRGYRTAGFAGNTLFLIPEYGLTRGFTRWRALTPWGVAERTSYGRKLFRVLTDRFGFRHLPDRRMAPHINAEMLAWLDATPGRPFFALLNYMDAHTPFWPPPPYDKKFTDPAPTKPVAHKGRRLNVSDYDNLLAYLDDHLAALFGELEKRGLLSNTLVLVTSDHGESLGDHDQYAHGQRLYRELCRVPLIAVGPQVVPGGRSQFTVSQEQIPATVADLLGHSDSPFPGPSFAAILRRSPAAAVEEKPILLELQRIDGAVAAKSWVHGPWHYIWTAKGGTEELYHMEDDPGELNNLAGLPRHQPRLEAFRERLRGRFPDLPIGKPPA